MWQSMPFAPRPIARLIPGTGMLLTTGAEPSFEWYSFNGNLIRRVVLDFPLIRVSAEERSVEIRRREREIKELEGMTRAWMQAMLDGLQFPKHKAFWISMSVDDAGYIWLRIPESETDRGLAGGGYAYHLVNPEGEYLGRTRIPEPGRIMQGHLLATIRDPETHEMHPTVWRLVPQAEGFIYP